MTRDENRIRTGWGILRSRIADGNELSTSSVVLDVSTIHGPLRLSVGGSGEPQLLIPLGMHDTLPSDFEGQALEIRQQYFSLGGRNKRFLLLECSEPELEQAFTGLVEELSRRVEEGGPPVGSLVSVVREFRDLLRSGSENVSRERAVGLVGELVVVQRIVELNPQGVTAWQGPDGARHDFRCGAHALEVKSSVKVGSRTVEITAADQLFPPDGATLHLHQLILEADPAGSLSVPLLHDRIEEYLTDTTVFREKLEKLGFLPGLSEYWERFRFSLVDASTYRVDVGFPRIGDDGGRYAPCLPYGISAVRYNLDLNYAADFRVDGERESELIRELAQCP